MNGGEIIGRVLTAQGVRFLYTLCGGHISPILVGAKQAGIRVIDTRHEATAVFAADATARLTGIPGVAAVTAGPGVTNTLTAVVNARLAQSPVVLLGGATATVLRGRGALQDIDQLALIRSSVKWAAKARRVRDLEPLLRQALRVAMDGTPGPVFLECPVDLLYDEALVRSWYVARSTPRPGAGIAEHAIAAYLRLHLNRQFASAPAPSSRPELVDFPQPRRTAIENASDRIAEAQRPLMVIGSQATLDVSEVDALRSAVERLGIPVYLSGMARGLLGADHPLQFRHKRRDALRAADLVVLAGVPCDFRLDYGAHIRPRTPVVSVNRSRADLRLNRRPDVAVHADASAFLRALARTPMPPPPDRTPWLSELRARDAVREAEIDAQAAASADGVTNSYGTNLDSRKAGPEGADSRDGFCNPLALCRQVDAQLADDSTIVADGGDFVATASYILRPRGALRWLDPGVFGTLGVGAGFALAAKLCRPDSDVWALFGDGALGYSLMEFDTFVRHGVAVAAVVGNDACWSQIAREQVEVLRDDVGCPLRATDYERAAEGLGARGLVIRNDGETGAVLSAARQAARAGQPVLVNALLGTSDFRKGSISM